MAGEIYTLVGFATEIIGLGTVAYGLITQDMETILAGAAAGYLGGRMIEHTQEGDRLNIARETNRIAQEKISLEKKVKE